MNWEKKSAIKDILIQRKRDKFAEVATPFILGGALTAVITMSYFAVIMNKICF